MDEATIVSAIQADLQNYKVKAQIRRKESQLHVLISRAEGDEIDYASLYDIVKRRVDKLGIEWANSLVLYGKIAGAKHPEWRKKGDLKPPLPLIEFDLDDLEELEGLEDLVNLTLPTETIDKTSTQVKELKSESHENFESFKQSIENDLKRAALKNGNYNNDINVSGNGIHKKERTEDFDFGDLDFGEFKLDNLNQKTFKLDKLEPTPLDADAFDLKHPSLNNRSPVDKDTWLDDNLASDQTTMAMPLLPPPPLPPKKQIPKPSDEIENQPELADTTASKSKSLLISSVFIVLAISVVGICGWLLWERSLQQKYIANARDLSNQTLNPKTATKLESLTETRNQLQLTILQLEDIPERPASLYTDAQVELTTLRPKLEEFDRKINLEQDANKKLESAKNGTIEAAKLVQNPPHKSTVWKSAQEKRQQAIKLLEEVPTDSLLYADAQKALKIYRSELVQISKWVDIQQRAESAAANVNPIVANQLKQLKSKSPEKLKFLPQCKIILQPQISNLDGQRVGLPTVTLTEYLCAYFWDS